MRPKTIANPWSQALIALTVLAGFPGSIRARKKASDHKTNVTRLGTNAGRGFFAAHIPDPYYAKRPFAPQDEPPVRRIHSLIHPTLGFPALAQCGKIMTLWVVDANLANDKRAEGPRSWSVRLSRSAQTSPVITPKVISVVRKRDLFRIQARLPADSPDDVYYLTVTGPGGFTDSQPRSVRVLCPVPKVLTFAVLSDHQLWDPSWKLKPGLKASSDFPDRGQTEDNKRITLQEFHELELIDPAFVLYPGDLVFGLDYEKEYSSMHQWWKNRRLAMFMVPGNHDGYARYTVRFAGSLPKMAVALLRCRKSWPTSRSWHKIFAYLSCVYGDIKNVLFSQLVHDGLVSFARTFGPPYYSFDLGRYHFVALNTYDGTNKRRHALSVWVPFKGLKLGAPAVDNYGGYLSERQLAWLERDMAQASARGQTIAVMGHQDPRGNEQGERYQKNEPFPTHPLGLGDFDEWDYDGAWDSNPHDNRGKEHPWDHSGVRLLRLLLRYASYYISGHVHEDETRTYHPGQVVVPGMVTKREISFIRVTTASAGVRHQGYWGYRLLSADSSGKIDISPYDEKLGLDSVPAGNFWLERSGKGNRPEWILHSAVPVPIPLVLRARLSFAPTKGYRFFARRPDGTTQPLQLLSADPDPRGGLATYRVAVTTPVASSDPPDHKERILTISAKLAKDNAPPCIIVKMAARLRRLRKGRTKRHVSSRITPRPHGTIRVAVGRTVSVDATSTYDPEHRPLIASYLKVERLCPVRPENPAPKKDSPKKARGELGSDDRALAGSQIKPVSSKGMVPCGTILDRRTTRAVFDIDRLGLYRVTVKAVDDAGAITTTTFFVKGKAADIAAPRPGCGCCAPTANGKLGATGLLSLLLLALSMAGMLWFIRRRRR